MRHRNSEPDDETAVRLALAGKREMFVLLLERHHASVLRLCERLLGSRTEAEDVVQEAALQAFLNLAYLREPRQFSAWLHSIAANLSRSALRRRRPLSLDWSSERTTTPLVDQSPTPEEVRLARELHDTVLEALKGLSDVNREAVTGYYLEGHSYAELAELLNVPLSTIKGRLYKGRRQLEPALSPVAREIFGKKPKRKEIGVNTQEMVEVVVDDVMRQILDKNKDKLEWLRENGSLSDLIGHSEDGPELGMNIMILREKDGERVLPIWMGLDVALSIWQTVSGRQIGPPVRPMTHDLMLKLLDTMYLQVVSVVVNRLVETTFYAEISLRQGEQSYQIDSRPSDAIALAVRSEVPIYVARPVMEQAGLETKQWWVDRDWQPPKPDTEEEKE